MMNIVSKWELSRKCLNQLSGLLMTLLVAIELAFGEMKHH